MILPQEFEDAEFFSDDSLLENFENDADNDNLSIPRSKEEELAHRREIRKRLEEKLERKRLQDEFEDFDFDWEENS